MPLCLCGLCAGWIGVSVCARGWIVRKHKHKDQMMASRSLVDTRNTYIHTAGLNLKPMSGHVLFYYTRSQGSLHGVLHIWLNTDCSLRNFHCVACRECAHEVWSHISKPFAIETRRSENAVNDPYSVTICATRRIIYYTVLTPFPGRGFVVGSVRAVRAV